MTTTIAAMRDEHAKAVLNIYRLGIESGDATFETEPPSWERFCETRLAGHRWVAINGNDTVVGWVACTAVSDRCVYAGVVENSIYIHPRAQGQGIGRLLLAALIDSTEAAGIWTIQSGIFPNNTASLALHAKMGFREVGIRERLGKQGGTWRDVVLVERRSARVGV
ncbi:MAG: N-acetyltransferase [Corynebacteriales bacterium]|nr:N-acetyltransferase [Mycobacteriales bacterium]